MGKTGRWIKSLLSGKKEKNNNTFSSSANHENEESTTVRPTTPISTTSKEKKRWSFRRSSVTPPLHKDFIPTSDVINTTPPPSTNSENDHKKLHAMAVAAAAAAARAAAVAIQLAAAVKIQAAFRGYLARKALNALKGLVKLQALVRGHLVRKQAAATLRCMQALVTVQARARAQRLRMSEDPRQSVHRKSMQDNKTRNPYQEYEEDIKIVEMDTGESRGSRNSYSNQVQKEERIEYTKQHISPAPSAITDQSPRACSGHFEEYSAQNSPQCYTKPEMPFAYARSEYAESLYNDYAFYPSYMANTQSSRAKVRSHSAPKQRPESLEKQPSRRRPSIEGRNVPRAVRMQRSSSHIGSTAQNYQYPWSIKLDRSNISIKDSECGSNCSVLTTHTNYCTSLVGFHVQGNRY